MKYYNLKFKKNNEEYSYTLSNKDILNLLRAVSKEGNPYDGVTWTLLQRFAWLYPTYDTLSEFIKAYAQPINPRWFPNGDKHKAYIRYLKNNFSGDKLAELIDNAEERAENRVDYASLELDEIDDKYKKIVYNILEGNETTPIKGAVHYIASRAAQGDTENQARDKQLSYATKHNHVNIPVYIGSSKLGNNWFFNVKGSNDFIVNPYTSESLFDDKSDRIALVFIISGAALAKLLKEHKIK